MIDQDASEAFRWLDANAESSIETPDEAFDRVFLLTQRDWTHVTSAWESRSRLWREAFAYFVIDGPIEESRQMLIRAICDTDDRVAQQAAISLCHQYVTYPENRIPIDEQSVSVIRALISRVGVENMEPVTELLAGFA